MKVKVRCTRGGKPAVVHNKPLVFSAEGDKIIKRLVVKYVLTNGKKGDNTSIDAVIDVASWGEVDDYSLKEIGRSIYEEKKIRPYEPDYSLTTHFFKDWLIKIHTGEDYRTFEAFRTEYKRQRKGGGNSKFIDRELQDGRRSEGNLRGRDSKDEKAESKISESDNSKVNATYEEKANNFLKSFTKEHIPEGKIESSEFIMRFDQKKNTAYVKIPKDFDGASEARKTLKAEGFRFSGKQKQWYKNYKIAEKAELKKAQQANSDLEAPKQAKPTEAEVAMAKEAKVETKAVPKKPSQEKKPQSEAMIV